MGEVEDLRYIGSFRPDMFDISRKLDILSAFRPEIFYRHMSAFRDISSFRPETLAPTYIDSTMKYVEQTEVYIERKKFWVGLYVREDTESGHPMQTHAKTPHPHI